MLKNLKKVRKILMVMIIMVLLLPGFAKEIHGATSKGVDFETTKYTMSVLVNKNHSYSISESITLKFNEDRDSSIL